MCVWYVKKMDSQDEIGFFKNIFLIPKIKQMQNNYIVILPIRKEISPNNQKIIGKKLAKKIYDKKNQNIVLSKSLDLDIFKDTLISEGLNILDGKWLFVSYMKKIELQELEVAIMVNDNSENTLKMLIAVSQKIKMLNIVTNDIDRFRSIEEYLFYNMGIVIRTTNNRKKALLKSDLIINIDFPEELVNSYSIPKDGIIINIHEKINIKSKRFCGINCNSYKVIMPTEKESYFRDNGLLDDFDPNLLIESIVKFKKTYESIENELRGSKIKYLLGNNGKIRDEEYKISQ